MTCNDRVEVQYPGLTSCWYATQFLRTVSQGMQETSCYHFGDVSDSTIVQRTLHLYVPKKRKSIAVLSVSIRGCGSLYVVCPSKASNYLHGILLSA